MAAPSNSDSSCRLTPAPALSPPGRALNRRRFLARSAALTLGATPIAHAVAGPAIFTTRKTPAVLQVALLATEVRKHSHAQHFIDRLLEGYGWQGRHYRPNLRLVSLYVDQFPEGDLARERSQRHQVKIYPTLSEALTRGSSRLAVDGVLIIAEHGKYPRNEKGQTLYPRYKFYKETVRVFEASGRSVPVFNDKHLSTNWAECQEMVQDSRRLGFAFLAGSSLPVTWRIPDVELALGTRLEESVCLGYGGVDSYDFHGLETAQCMSERRRSGESGVRAIHAVRGDTVWTMLQQHESTLQLFFAALTRSHTVRPPPGFAWLPPTLDSARRAAKAPVAYFIEHNDRFRTTMFLLNGFVQDFTYAGRISGGKIASCQMHLPMPNHISSTADFFNPLMYNIEQTIVNRRTPYPIERTLLTSGMTLSSVESLHRGQIRVETPELNVAYRGAAAPAHWRA